MALEFDLARRNVLDKVHGKDVYRFNLARNYALLSGDSAVIRKFYQEGAAGLGAADIIKHQELERSFFSNARLKNAFVYAGLIPWIVESIVRLVASSGFTVNSPLQGVGEFEESLKKDMDAYIQSVCEYLKLQDKFVRGVYLESGLGDFAYRISLDKSVSNKPIVDIILPQFLEVEYRRGFINKITIKESTEDLQVGKGNTKTVVEIREIYTKKHKDNEPYILLEYKFYNKGKEITQNNPMYGACKKHWDIEKMELELPFKDFPIVYKQNNKQSELYRSERGVPDIHGLDTIEDALSENNSNLIDAIRKAAPKIFVDSNILTTDIKGETAQYSAFDHEYLIVDGQGADPSKLLTTVQANIDWQAYIETSKMLISNAINKVGLSPTTLGVTGLESINSSVESQDAREKPSLRTRELKLDGWKDTLEELLNKYFQYVDYVNGEPIGDYADMLNVSFNKYINPSTENVVSVISQAVAGRVYSVEVGVEKNFIHEGKDYTLNDIIIESARIRGITPQEEMALLGLMEPEQPTDLPEEGEVKTPEADNQNILNKPTMALNEED